MVLGKLTVPGQPTYLDYSRARAYCACGVCGWGCLDIFSLIYHLSFSFSLSLGDGPIQTEILSQRAFKPKNQPNVHKRGDGVGLGQVHRYPRSSRVQQLPGYI